MSYSSDVLALSPLAYYRLGETSGTTMADSSGNARDGVYNGSVTLGVTGIPGAGGNKAAAFGADANQYGQIANSAWMNRTTDLSWGCWFKTTSTGLNYLIQKWPSSALNLRFGLDLNTSNAVRAYIYANSTQKVLSSTVTGLRDGNWHMAVATWDDATDILTLYVDGVSVGTLSAAGPLAASASSDLLIGRREGTTSGPMNGTIDEVFVGPVLTSTQVANLYASGASAVNLGGTVGIVTETDAAQAFGRRKSKAAGVVAETDAAQAITRVKRYTVGTALETDAAVHVTRPGIFLPTSETDTAQPFGRVKRYTVGTATETDGAQSVAKSKRRTVGTPTETDAAQLLKRTRPYVIGTAVETDAAQQITQSGIIARIIGTAIETDTALSVGVVQYGGDIPEDPPIEPEPTGLAGRIAPLRIMASALPAPDFVDGRPA